MSSLDIIDLSTSAYLADTQHLSLPQHGAYLLIMMTMQRAKGWIPDDDRVLANICKLSVPKWKQIATEVRALLMSRDGKLSQKRLLSGIEKTLKTISVNAQNGRAGGVAKSLKTRPSTVATAKISPDNSLPRPLPSESERSSFLPSLVEDSQLQKKEKKGSRGSSLSADWTPTAKDVAYGIDLGFTRSEVAKMAEDMKLWALANANRPVGRKANWTAAFHGWLRRELDKLKSNKRETRNGGASLLVEMMERQNEQSDGAFEDERSLPSGRH